MKNIKISSFLICIFLLGCGNSTTTTVQSKSSNSSEKSCLEQNIDTPCNILTAEKILELTGLESSKIELKEPMSMKIAGGIQCVYLWDSGRTEQTKTAIGNMESKLKDKIDLGHFRIYDTSKTELSAENWFKNSYPTISKEELAIRETNHKEKLANGDKDLNEGFLIRTFNNLERTRVDDLGDRALVDLIKKMSSVSVIVMDKNISFQVSVDISKDVQKNLEVAKKIVRSVLETCD